MADNTRAAAAACIAKATRLEAAARTETNPTRARWLRADADGWRRFAAQIAGKA